MMVKRTLLWGYASQFLQYGSALIVLPVVLTELTSAELGIWYVYMTIAAFVPMFEMGFTPTLARNISYVMGGARTLLKEGVEQTKAKDVDYGMLKSLIGMTRIVFLVIAIGTCLILSTLGTWYIEKISSSDVPAREVMVSWVIFVAAITVNTYFKYYTPLLQGRGLFTEYYKANTSGNLVFVMCALLLLWKGAGLPGLAVSYLLSAIVGRFLSWHYLNDARFLNKLRAAKDLNSAGGTLFSALWQNSYKLGLVAIGTFLALRGNTLLASVYLGLELTAQYALTLQAFSVVQNLSMVAFTIQQPKLATYRVTGKKDALIALIRVFIVFTLLSFLLGSALLICFGNPVLRLIGSHTSFLPAPMLLFLGVILLLELNHSVAATIIVSGNTVPFANPALISGMAMLLVSVLLITQTSLGLWALLLSQFLVQIAYNNWKWPLAIGQELGRSYWRLLWDGVTQMARFNRKSSA